MPFKRLRFKRIGSFFQRINPPPIIPPGENPPSETPINVYPQFIENYLGIDIYLNQDQEYFATISGTIYRRTSLDGSQGLKYVIEVVLETPTPPPPTSLPETVIVNSTIQQTSSLNGNGITLKAGPNLGDKPIMSISGSGITVENVKFDDSDTPGVTGAVMFGGSNNILRWCGLDHCVRYGFVLANATNCKILNNTVKKAQYCISGASGSGNAYWAKTCEIAYNQLSGMVLTGIKIKSFDTVKIHDNIIDVTPLYGSSSKQGLNFSHDAPSLHVSVYDNHIRKMAQGTGLPTYGILTEEDLDIVTPLIHSSDNLLQNNIIDGVIYGIYLKGDNFTVKGNVITNTQTPYTNQGNNNIIDNLD